MESKPKARKQGLVAEPLDDGMVVYDSSSKQAHALDGAATRVWRLADGTRTVAEIAATAVLGEPVTAATLERLATKGLLHADPEVSRRSLLKRTAVVGAGALAVAPLIETLVIPTAAAHASTNNTPFTPPTRPMPPGGPPLVLEQPPVTFTPSTRPPKKKKKKKKKKHVVRHHKKRRKPPRRRSPSFTG
jgi:coenzyme PQQ synthesis protein D (PqqD)